MAANMCPMKNMGLFNFFPLQIGHKLFAHLCLVSHTHPECRRGSVREWIVLWISMLLSGQTATYPTHQWT